MIRIVVHVDAPLGSAIGIKEILAIDLERFGDARIVEVSEIVPEQMKIGGTR